MSDNKHEKKPRKERGSKKAKKEALPAVAHKAKEMIRGYVRDGYVRVSTDEKGRVTTDVKVPKEVTMAREYMRAQLGSRPFRTQIILPDASFSGSANTALSAASAVNLVNSGEWTSWAALFDEVRAMSWKTDTWTSWSNGSLTPATGIPFWSAATAFQTGTVSLARVLESTKTLGPLPLYSTPGLSGSAAMTGSAVQAVTEHGKVTLHSGPLMRDPLLPNSGGTVATQPVQGAWVPTSSSAVVLGWVLYYAEAAGANVTVTARQVHTVGVEFRMRQ